MSAPIRLRTTVALLVVIGLAALGLARAVSADLQLPAARLIVAESQRFEGLARAGHAPLPVVDVEPGTAAVPPAKAKA